MRDPQTTSCGYFQSKKAKTKSQSSHLGSASHCQDPSRDVSLAPEGLGRLGVLWGQGTVFGGEGRNLEAFFLLKNSDRHRRVLSRVTWTQRGRWSGVSSAFTPRGQGTDGSLAQRKIRTPVEQDRNFKHWLGNTLQQLPDLARV